MFIVATVVVTGVSRAAHYQDAVFALSPNYYYQLDETSTTGGAIDSTGHAAPGVFSGAYPAGQVGFPGPITINNGMNPPIPVPGVGGAANRSHFGNNVSHINLGPQANYAANAMTIAMFVKGGPSDGGDRLFTNNVSDPTKSLTIAIGKVEGLCVGINPGSVGKNAVKALKVPDNSTDDRGLSTTTDWWHIVVSTSGDTVVARYDNIQVWVNGVNRTANMLASSSGFGVENTLAKIGGRSANPASSQTHSGAQDEVSIWLNRVLTESEVNSLWQAAIVPEPTGYHSLAMAGVVLAFLHRTSNRKLIVIRRSRF